MDEQEFASQIWKYQNNQLDITDTLLVRLHTPLVLQKLDLRDLPMLYTQKHLKDALQTPSAANPSGHGLDVKTLIKVPVLLDSPAFILKSERPNKKGILRKSYVCVLPLVDKDKKPIIVPIAPDGRGFYAGQERDTNCVLSIYGRNNFTVYLAREQRLGNVLYADKQQILRLESLSSLQLLGTFSSRNLNVPQIPAKMQGIRPQTTAEVHREIMARTQQKLANFHAKTDSQVRGQSLAVQSHEGSLTPIVGDDFRQYHPDYKRLLLTDPLSMPDVTAEASGRWIGLSVDYANRNGISTIIEGTWRNSQTLLDGAKQAKSYGRMTHAVVVAGFYGGS